MGLKLRDMRRLKILSVGAVLVLLSSIFGAERTSAQHTLTVVGGAGASYARFYPYEETKWMWGTQSYGLSWRFYSAKPRFVGAVGVDLEYMERGFRYGYTYNTTFEGEGEDRKEIRHYKFYRRNVQSLMLPIVWQPHVYAFKNRLRVFLEAAFVLSYNISSNYSYEDGKYPGGKYNWKVPRDNRIGYGLLGGLGFAVLVKQVEIGFKARYNFGYSDLMKNRNKYYSSSTDGRENPFYYTPLRSPVDNLTFSLTVGWRFNKRGFDSWFVERPKRTKRLDSFNFSEATNQANGGGRPGAQGNSRPGGQNTSRPGGAMRPGTTR